MLSKNEIRYYSSLLKKKFRDEQKKFLAEGKKIVLEGIKSGFKCESIFTTNEFKESTEEFFEEIKSFVHRVEILKKQDFLKLSDTVHPQGVAAIFLMPKKNSDAIKSLSSRIVVCLEEISDPGNLGTILRNCDWFGIKDIILSKSCAEVYNPKTIRAGMGSNFHLNIFDDVDLPDAVELLKKSNYKIFCADLDGKNIFNQNKIEKLVIVFSNEANGPSDQILNLADEKITIPKIGKAESLNVASASAIILADLTKK